MRKKVFKNLVNAIKWFEKYVDAALIALPSGKEVSTQEMIELCSKLDIDTKCSIVESADIPSRMVIAEAGHPRFAETSQHAELRAGINE